MKKVFIPTLLLATSAVFAFAQEPKTNYIVRPTTDVPMQATVGGSASVSGGAASAGVTTSGSAMMMPIDILMPGATTGDTAVDAKLQTLRKEFETKLKALIEEYRAKAKVVLGDKKIKVPEIPAGTVPYPMPTIDGSKGARPPVTSTSTTETRVNPAGRVPNGEANGRAMDTTGRPVPAMMMNDSGAQTTGPLNAIRGFFRSIFGTGASVDVNTQIQAQ